MTVGGDKPAPVSPRLGESRRAAMKKGNPRNYGNTAGNPRNYGNTAENPRNFRPPRKVLAESQRQSQV